ncbi:LysR family transcriptional regulator [Bosea sp. Root381]|uniref:pca operon transcription factor PcaQ n=1 Tax=Bosea sp. Root381 TaxID=1736524 RepID=UPI0006FC8373|nr:pca operon transcription factor PcaQ [Bosea sp. Root381]KRE15810.1 LysR family transcriptional regulator [Bosea sp. Root381]
MIDSRIRLRHLAAFLEVVQLGSVAAAANVLAVTQPAVSKTLRELEEVLGVRLFDRSARSLVLSAAGEVFLRHAEASMSALRRGIASVRLGESRPVLRIGVLPTASARTMPEAMMLLKSLEFKPVLRIVTGDNHVLLGQLRGGELDLVVGRFAGPEPMIGLSFEQLYSEPLAFVVRPDHPAMDGAFDPRRLSDFTVLMPPPRSVIRPTVDAFLTAKGVAEIRDQIETVSMAFGRRYVRISDAIWIISTGVVAEDLSLGLLNLLDVDMRDTQGPVGITTRAGEIDADPSLAVVAQALRAASAPYRPGGAG